MARISSIFAPRRGPTRTFAESEVGRPHAEHPGISSATLAVRLMTVTLLSLAACSPQLSSHGREHVTAAYSLGTLVCDLPDSVRVPAIMAAAEGALRGRGYSISSKASTDDRGRVYARAPRDSQVEGVSIEARVTSTGHQVSIHFDPLGDDSRSRVLLDDLLARLGR